MGASLEEFSSISLESHSFITTGKENSDSEDEIIIKKKLTRKVFIVSDDDNDDNDDNDNSKNDGEFVKRPELSTSVDQVGQNLDSDKDEGILKTPKRKKRVLMQNEDESDVDDPLPVSQNESESIETQSVSKQKSLSDVNKDSLVSTQKRLALFQDSSLYDAESSDEETVQSFSNNKQNLGPSRENNLKGATKKKEVHSNKPKSSTKTTKEQSAKSNKNEIHKIHSESQRMLRETRLSLPYHRPRQRTLTEFLQRRKTIPNIPKSLKPTEEQMIEICKHLEEREKETKEFFKSESEESDTEDKSESGDKETTCNNSREKISSSQPSEANGPLKDSVIQSFSEDLLRESEQEDTSRVSCDIVEELNTAVVTDVVESEDLVLKFSESQNMSDATKTTKEKDDHDSTNKNTDKVDSALKSIKDKSSKSSNDKGSEKDLCLASYLKDIFLNKSVEDSGDEKFEYNKMPTALKKSLTISGSFPDIKPRLSRGPNNLIDLEVVPTPGGVKSLIQRFFEHSTAKKPPAQKRKVELGIVSAEKGSEGIESVVKDTVTVILGEDELSSAGEKPGTKMLRLRKELQQQISKRKSEEWSRRLQEAQLDNEKVPTGESSDCGILDEEEEEAEMTDTETEEEEEEEEDMLIIDSKRLKSDFIEDEAELSDGGEAADVSSDEEEDDQEETEKVEGQDIYDKDENTNEETVSQRVTDSDEDLGIDDTCPIPPYQPQRNVTSERAPPESVEKTSFSFLSPVISLPGGALQSWSSVKSGGVSPMTPNGTKTSRDRTKLQLTQKKLFTEPDSQDNLNEFMGLSREFTGSPHPKADFRDIEEADDDDKDSQLLQELAALLKRGHLYIDAEAFVSFNEHLHTEEGVEKAAYLVQCDSADQKDDGISINEESSSGETVDNLKSKTYSEALYMSGKKVSTLVNTTDPIDSDSELLGLCSGQFVSQTVDLASLEEEDERNANFAQILNTQSNSQLEDSQDQFRLNLSNDFLSPVKMVQELTALVQ
uniref:Claspin n=1 Tax=Timema shepardi TaxID=629360 RepID=A0A7R9B3T1_TIMSH|nr:unnamed protein product [Timema shepardi]